MTSLVFVLGLLGAQPDPSAPRLKNHLQLLAPNIPGIYAGIGTRVSLRRDERGDTWFTIEEVVPGSPALEAGIRPGDRIVTIEGQSTRNRVLFSLVRILRGDEGTKVTLEVYRRGWIKPRSFTLERRAMIFETTTHRMLPGDIGYIRLLTFGPSEADKVEKAVENLPTAKALLLDLRGNIGGFLRTAQHITGHFLPKGKLVVIRRGRGVEIERRITIGRKLTDVPLVLLADGASASATEVLIGALRHHKRAVFVGEKTFGKGSTQDLRFLKTKDEKTGLIYTRDRWYFPDGRPIEGETPEERGIAPDVPVELPERELWRDVEMERLRDSAAAKAYLGKHWDKELFGRLARSDNGDASQYPQFEAFYVSLKTRLSRDDVRRIVRQLARTKIEVDGRKPLPEDIQSDRTLQAGIIEAGKLAKIALGAIPEYRHFSKEREEK